MSPEPRIFYTEGFRLSAIFVAVFVTSAIVLAACVLYIVAGEFRDQIVQFANDDIAAIRDGYRTEGLEEAREVITQRMADPETSDFFLLQDAKGSRLGGNLMPMTSRVGVFTLPYAGKDAQHVILGVGAFIVPGLYVFSGSDLYRLNLARERILQSLMWILAGALAFGSFGGYVVSREFLRRTDAIAKTCRSIMDGDLRSRIPTRGTRDELDRLAENVNEMLDRIATLMENLRQVTNDVAHDLRTPLTHLRHSLERARGEAISMADYDRAMESAIAASDEILALFAALLRIAQIEGGARRAGFTSLKLEEPLHHLIDVYRPVAEDAGHHLIANLADNVIVRGDRDLLLQLFSNLIENAIIHTPTGTRIAVTMYADKDAVVTVCDDGPGVPLDEHANVFRRFYRRETSRSTPGNGLGLALVAAVADLHGAIVVIDKNSRVGFCVKITIPMAKTS